MNKYEGHTPGPWTWQSDEGFESNYAWELKGLTGGDGSPLIELRDIYPGYPECGQDLVLEMSPPNARLIADAPELLRQRDALLEACKSIASLGGNLNDDRLTDRTGPNDAASRGIMYCSARELAREAIKLCEKGAQ